MSEKLITSRELAVILGISMSTMNTHLGTFNRYLVKHGMRFYYKYNYYFLKDLRDFYKSKLHNSNIVNSKKFKNASIILGKLMRKAK